MTVSITSAHRHTRAHRCTVCDGADGDPRGKSKRCSGFVSSDGEYVHCSRDELAGGIAANEAGLYAHRRNGPCRCGVTHGEATSSVFSRDKLEASYDYRDERGTLLFQVVRKAGKRFLQRCPDGAGGWIWKLGETRRVLYRLPELVGEDGDRVVHVVEGEKDADTLTAKGFLATCNPGGAGKWQTVAELAREVLRDRDVIIIADRDDVGRKHAGDVFESLRGIARSLVTLTPPAPHKDATDLLSAGGSLTELIAIDATPIAAPMIALLDGKALAAPLPPLDYLVREIGLVAGPGAPHLIAGYGFAGKTLAAQSMALDLAAHRAVWGAYRATQAFRVVHVDLEQGERLDARRYQRLALASGVDLASLGDALVVAAMPSISLAPEHESAWRELMTGRDLAIVDSLRAATAGADENDSSIRAGLDMLGALSEATGCRALVIHHARKPSNDDPGGRYAIRGSSAIYDACDSVYVFSAAKGEPVLVDHVKARTHGEPCEPIALVIEDVEAGDDRKAGVRVLVHGAELVTQRREERERKAEQGKIARDAARVRDVIASAPGIGTRELRTRTSLSGDRVAAALAHLGTAVEVREEPQPGRRPKACHYLQGSAS